MKTDKVGGGYHYAPYRAPFFYKLLLSSLKASSLSLRQQVFICSTKMELSIHSHSLLQFIMFYSQGNIVTSLSSSYSLFVMITTQCRGPLNTKDCWFESRQSHRVFSMLGSTSVEGMWKPGTPKARITSLKAVCIVVAEASVSIRWK